MWVRLHARQEISAVSTFLRPERRCRKRSSIFRGHYIRDGVADIDRLVGLDAQRCQRGEDAFGMRLGLADVVVHDENIELAEVGIGGAGLERAATLAGHDAHGDAAQAQLSEGLEHAVEYAAEMRLVQRCVVFLKRLHALLIAVPRVRAQEAQLGVRWDAKQLSVTQLAANDGREGPAVRLGVEPFRVNERSIDIPDYCFDRHTVRLSRSVAVENCQRPSQIPSPVITSSKTFRAVAEAVVPEIRQIDNISWQNFASIVEHALSQRPAGVQRQLALFLNGLNILSVVKYGRRVSALIPSMRTEFLESIERSGVLLLRRGFWGLRTLILMGYYARPEAAARIGYRAHANGWNAR